MTERETGRSRRLVVAAGLALLAGLLAPPAARAAAPQGSIKDGVFSPGRPAAAAYGSDAEIKCKGSIFSRLTREVERQSKAAGLTPPQPEGKLCAIAESLLGWSEEATPREGVLAFLSGYLGMVTPARQVFVTVIETDDEVLISERLAETITASAKAGPNARYGVAMYALAKEDRFSKPRNRLVLVLGDEPVVLKKPLPRRLALGEKAALAGEVQGNLENPRVTISDVKGQVSAPPQVPGMAFQAEIACGDKAGTIRVEIGAEQSGARRVAANFPVACGIDLPVTVPVQPVAWPADVAAQEKKVLEMINADRASVGIPPAVWDDAVAGVARELSAALADPERRAGAGAAVVDQMKKAGVATSLLLVNPAQGRTVDEAQERLLTSPGHRANAMNPEVNHAGIGITRVTDKAGGQAVFMAELFVKFLPPMDVAQVRDQLVKGIGDRRAEAKVAPLPVDPALQEAAQKYAQEMAAARGSLPEERDAQMLDSLKKAYKSINMLAGASASPMQFTQEKKVLAAGKALGVGVAQGDHPALGRNTAFVVILIGEQQDAPKAKPAKKGATK